MRVLICGDRHWDDRELIKKTIQLITPTFIINGAGTGHPGADALATDIAKELGIDYKEYPADWEFLKAKAGPIRNTQMLVEGRPELILAFHDYIETSKGTKDMVGKAARAGVPVLFIKHDEQPHLAKMVEMAKLLNRN
jgi:hypothetical protein